MSDPRTAVLLLAAGAGTRVGAPVNKVLLPLRGTPVLAWSLRTILSLPYVERLVVVARAADVPAVREATEEHLPEGRTADLVVGGEVRHDSEWRGLAPLRDSIHAGDLDVVVVHDAARPLAGPALFDATVRAAHEHGGAIPVRPQPGLVTRDGDRHVHGLVGVQTPQAFRAAELLDAYARADADGFTGTDTASCFATYARLSVRGVPAPATNLKITFPEDVLLAERLLTPR
ncbi:MAG: 2-C-methyl-D-erythritol 4-phosphate cytidylyltransferase [Nocardioidaceae bacterium]|nr:2-C-methyl-D-erythritol 4-phosphate cytidylyltransferase [Nocardioidaceae bacterium]